jgi:hypothetical protein
VASTCSPTGAVTVPAATTGRPAPWGSGAVGIRRRRDGGVDVASDSRDDREGRAGGTARGAGAQLTIVPIGSPHSARLMLPFDNTSNTMIGSWLSMQNVMAVESMTCRPSLSTSM